MVKTTEYSKKNSSNCMAIKKAIFIYLFIYYTFQRAQVITTKHIPIAISMCTYLMQRKVWKRGWADNDVDVYL